MMGVVGKAVDFFVSYTTADRPWAEWIAWELEHAGYSVVIQAWDFAPGSNFVLEMQNAVRVATRTITVLSPAFLQSPYCAAEWAAAFRVDPTGEQRKLVPVRIRECDPEGLLGAIVYVDVVGLSETASRAALLAGVADSRPKPPAVVFPGAVGGRGGEQVRRPEAGAAIFNVPVTTRTFVGRHEQLRRLAAGLSGDGVVAITQVQAIHGMGGVGKTQLAARYAREHRDDYDVVWWLRAEQQPTLHADLADLAVALGLADIKADEQDAITAALRWLQVNGRWLLVFDNTNSPGALAGVLPEGRGGHVVITSRVHADWRALHAQPLALDVWQRAESREFLRQRTGDQDINVADAVADALGDLPLALEQAAAYTNTKAITLTGYAERLRDRAPQLFSAARPAGYEHTIATVWKMAFDQISQHPIANDLLGVCSHLAPERIPRELLEAVVEHSEVAGVDQQAQTADDAIELLLRYALLTAAAEQTFDMHRLIGQLTDDKAGPAAQARAAAAAAAALAALWPERSWEHEQWPTCERLLSHVLTAAERGQQHNTASWQIASLLGQAGQYEEVRARLKSARELTTQALEICERVYGPETPQVGVMLTSLGIVQRRLGEFEPARESLQRALAILEAVYGPEHPEVATTLNNLGLVQQQFGEFEPARESLQRALAILEAVYGPEHANVAGAQTTLGSLQRQLGEFEPARESLQRALGILEAVYGPEHPEVATTLNSLGLMQYKLGELELARVNLQRALEIKETVYGPEHPDVAGTLNSLGLVQYRLGELELARVNLQRALEIAEAVYGPEHHEVATLLRNLGDIQCRLGEVELARVSLQRALAIEEAVYGPGHLEVATTLTCLSLVERDLGELEPARTSVQRALDILEAVYGPEHPDVATTLMALGNLRAQLGEPGSARESVQRALAILEAVYGPEHPDVAGTLINLGNRQRQLGELEPALESLQRALAINEAVYGLEHPDVAITLTNLGLLQQELGELEPARASLKRALAIFERSFGQDHGYTDKARSILMSLGRSPTGRSDRHRTRRFRSRGG
jgi:tetratricopeptide (TPR) repeat protein